MNRQILAATGITVALLISGVVVGAFYLGRTTNLVTTTQSSSRTTSETTPSAISSSCYYVLPEAVPCLPGQNFTLSVNYTGQWKVTYQGYNCLGENCGKTTVTGSYSGTGFDSRNIAATGSANGWTLCAQAQKLDGSSATLTMVLGGENSTSLPFGSASFCDEEQLA